MKIVSLNVRHGGGPRSSQILDWLFAQSADIIMLSEWRTNASGASLKAAIEGKEYMCFATERTGANGLLFASKHPFSALRLTPSVSSTGEIIAADLEAGTRILCCYFPQKKAKKPFFEMCLDQAVQTQTPLLLIGDLNTGRNEIDLEQGATKFDCADQFVALTDGVGMIDLWRRSNGSSAQEWTWRSIKNGFRIDHALANAALISSAPRTRCWYDHSTRTDGLTDHSGMIVEVA